MLSLNKNCCVKPNIIGPTCNLVHQNVLFVQLKSKGSNLEQFQNSYTRHHHAQELLVEGM